MNVLFAFALMVAFGSTRFEQTPNESFKVVIINTGEYMPPRNTDFPSMGAVEGTILNFHYYPGIKYYQGGRYLEANAEFTYFLARPTLIEGDPYQAQYLSTGFYLRGMIFLHHAMGYGRLTLAKQDFEAAIKWNPKNYLAHLELSRVFSAAGLKENAISVIRHLLELSPPPEVVEEAEKELNTLAASDGK